MLADAEPGGPAGIEVETHAVLAAAAAGMRDWTGYDVHLERVAARVEHQDRRKGAVPLPGARPSDVAWCLRLAEARAEAASDLLRAARARRLVDGVSAGSPSAAG